MLDRNTPPPFREADIIGALVPKEKRVNDISLYWWDQVEQPAVRIEIVWPAGRWFEPKPGVSHFLAALLDKGTRNRSAIEIAEKLEFHGSSLEAQSGYDYLTLTLLSIESQVTNVLPVLFDVITESCFPGDELRIAKNIYLQNLQVNRQKNSFLASVAMRENLFGTHHPYGSKLEEAEMEEISVDLLSKFFQQAGCPVVFVTGRLSPKEIELLSDFFRSQTWRETPPRTCDPLSGPPKICIDRKDSLQTALRLAKLSIYRQHPDYAAVVLMNHILGGYFGSRLMRNIREEKGLTYGIYSSINPFLHGSLQFIAADVNRQNRDLAIDEIRRELRSLNTLHEDELMLARNHFLGSLQLEVANPFSIMDRFKTTRLMGLGPNFYEQMAVDIKSLSLDRLLETAGIYFTPHDFNEIAIG